MSGALLRKELRSLRPFLFVVLAILLVDLIDVFLTPFGAPPFSGRMGSLSEELVALQILLGFALGTSLLVREIDDGTLNFLDGLPVTRRAVFGAKITAAMLVLLILPCGLLLLNGVLHGTTRNSLDATLQPALFLTMFALSILVTAVALASGMLLGFLRALAWLVLVLCATGVKLLQDYKPSLAAALDTADLLTLRFSGGGWQLPWTTIWTQLGAALLFGGAAFALFSSAGKVRAGVQRIGRARRWLKRLLLALMVVAAIAGLVKLIERSRSADVATRGNAASAVEFVPIASAHATTSHYSFTYPALSSARVRTLVKQADGTFDTVAGLLKTEGGAPIDVDLSGTTDNHAGTAYLDRIRMQVRDEEAIATLAHETSHVLARRLAGGARSRQLEDMMVFNEGLAEWVETAIKKDPEVTGQHELAAAIVSSRRLVTPRQLTDQDAFASAVDENLKYPLGAILIERFIARYGPAAPKTLLLALGRADFPRDLKGYVLWQTAFQLAGFDLDLVLDDYARYLKQLEPRYARQIAQLPRPRGSLVESAQGNEDDEDDAGDDAAESGDYAIALRFDLPVPRGATPLVRFRPGASTDSARYRTRYGQRATDGKYSVAVPGNIVTRGEVCFQPGMIYQTLTVYERWTCLPVQAAAK